MQLVHAAYHERHMERVHMAGSEWWPFVDAIVMPGVIYKKHDVFETEELEGNKWPVMMPLLYKSDLLRPLAIARGLLVHRLHVLEGHGRPDGEAWPDCQTASLLGPCQSLPGYEREHPGFDHIRGILMRCRDRRTLLWNMGSEYPRAYVIPMPFELEGTRCDRGGRYVMKPIPLRSYSFDRKEHATDTDEAHGAGDRERQQVRTVDGQTRDLDEPAALCRK